MRGHIALLACVLLLFTLTAFVSCNTEIRKPKIKVVNLPDDIRVSCVDTGFSIFKGGEKWKSPQTFRYSDELSGEYTCKMENSTDDEESKIFVKFRTCDNCIQLDAASIIGMAVGNVIATGVIGVAVYQLVAQSRTAALSSHKKSFDRQHLLPNDSSSGAPNDHYQPLRLKGEKETYDVLSNVR